MQLTTENSSPSLPVQSQALDQSEPAIYASVEDAIARSVEDAGALFAPAILEAIKEIRQTDLAQWARIRSNIKAARIARIGELERLTQPIRNSNPDSPFEDVVPWSESVNGSVLLTDICNTLRQYVVADEATIVAAALWCMHTWCIDNLTVSPLAQITAPEKRCGKTIMLTALENLSFRPMSVSNITSAAMFRSIKAWQPTLLIDEADSFLRDNQELRGVLNSGFYKRSAFVVRTVGDDHIPMKFPTWAAKAICGIGRLPETIEDRSIHLRMRRKLVEESVRNIRHSDDELWLCLKGRMARWAQDHGAEVGVRTPESVDGLNDRAQDCWEPLLAIADICGGDWPRVARDTALTLSGGEEELPSAGTQLLGDIRDVFDHLGVPRLTSARLIEALTRDEELPWATWNRGSPITPRQLAMKLAAFDIKPVSMKLQDGRVQRGYFRSSFDEALEHYAAAPAKTATPLPNGELTEFERPS